jgi:hypothetical protein
VTPIGAAEDNHDRFPSLIAMSIIYAIDAAHGRVVASASGPLTTQHLARFFRASARDSRVTLAMSRLLDLRNVTAMPPPEELRWLVKIYRSQPVDKSARVAVIVTDDVADGVATMFGGLAGMFDQLKVFRDAIRAVAWLNETRPK